MLRDVLCEQEMIGYLDDEYRRQLEVTGEALIDYLEAKNDDAPQYRNRLSHKLEHVMKSMNMELRQWQENRSNHDDNWEEEQTTG